MIKNKRFRMIKHESDRNRNHRSRSRSRSRERKYKDVDGSCGDRQRDGKYERTTILGEGTMMNTIDVEREDHTTAEEGIEIETGRTRDEEEEEGGIERDPPIQ